MGTEDIPSVLPQSVTVDIKPWYKSKTVWLAVLVGLMGAADALTNGSLLGAEAAAWILFGKSVLDLIIRRVTTQPIGK